MKRKSGEELTGQAKLVWDNLEATGNDTDKLMVILQKNGYPNADKQTVSLARNALRNKGYEVPFAPKTKSDDKSKKTAGRPRPVVQPPQEAQPVRPAVATAPSKATSIDKKIEEIKAQIAKLQEDLAALERAKAIMES